MPVLVILLDVTHAPVRGSPVPDERSLYVNSFKRAESERKHWLALLASYQR